MCTEAELRSVREQYPQLRTRLGALLVVAHQKYCGPRIVTALTVVAWGSWVAALLLGWFRVCS